jgi:hypothetical protein
MLTPDEKVVACKTYPRTPPKLIDLDLSDKILEQIKTHDYKNSGPLMHVYSTVMLHLPMAYPAEYNEPEANNNYANGMPSYFAKDEVKGPATINDQRWATNKGVQFVDDLFGKVVKAYKDAGQWNNTIIYFTSDNGGVIYQGTANNNYPLRASKFSPFEGAFLGQKYSFFQSINLTYCIPPFLINSIKAAFEYHNLFLEVGSTKNYQAIRNEYQTPTSSQTI